MVAKSHAMAAWERRNSDQVTDARSGAGSMPARSRIARFSTLRWCGPGTELGVESPVAPGRVLVRKAENQPAECSGGRRSAGWPWGLSPVTCDAPAVPAQQGVGGDEPALAEAAGECGCDRPEQAPVISYSTTRRSVTLPRSMRDVWGPGPSMLPRLTWRPLTEPRTDHPDPEVSRAPAR